VIAGGCGGAQPPHEKSDKIVIGKKNFVKKKDKNFFLGPQKKKFSAGRIKTFRRAD
jgi:hypothetical protein